MFQAFPCLYVLVTERAFQVYDDILQIIQKDFKLNVSAAYIDYDLSLRDVMVKCYPRVTLKAFWYQFCLAIRRKCQLVPHLYESIWNDHSSELFHQFLCLPLLEENEILEGVNILKQKVAMNAVIKIIESFIRREGLKNICVDWETFGKQCSTNHNETLKLKFINPNANTSLHYLIGLMMEEQIKIEKAYVCDLLQDKCSYQNAAIKKTKEDLRKGKIDVSMFFVRLTFCDNSYHLKDMDAYKIGDEHEYINDDGAYQYFRPNEAPEIQRRTNPRVQQRQVQHVASPVVENNDDNCVVCLAVKKNTIVEPCNHLKFCFECIKMLHEGGRGRGRRRNGQPKCSVCRLSIDNYKLVFL